MPFPVPNTFGGRVFTMAALSVFSLLSAVAQQTPEDNPHGLSRKGDTVPDSVRLSSKEFNQAITPLYINRGDNLVGIHYTSWFDIMLGNGANVFRIDKALEMDAENPPYGPLGAWHFWAKPAMGFYRSSNPFVIRKHLEALGRAGIDFIILDDTNMQAEWDEAFKRNIAFRPYSVVLETARALLRVGEAVPRVVIWTTPEGGKSMWEYFYSQTEYENVLLRSDENGEDKPFLLITSKPLEDEADAPFLPFLEAKFHVRYFWGLKSRDPKVDMPESEWEYLSRPPQHVAMHEGEAEHISVAAAMQGNWMSIPHPARLGRRGGKTFQDQWRRAFNVRPRIVTVAWWNEWAVQRRYDPEIGDQFIDNYTREFSRDIAPMEGGHGDLYYQFLKRYVEAYKYHLPFPEHLLEENFSFEKARQRAREDWPHLGIAE